MEINKETKIMNENVMVFTGQMARQLLRKGFTIVDIKPDKLDGEGKRSVFVFKKEDNILDVIKELSTKNKE
jgi:hypothetical protein